MEHRFVSVRLPQPQEPLGAGGDGSVHAPDYWFWGTYLGVVDGPSVCRTFNSAIRGGGTPRDLSSDHDPPFEFHRWKADLRIFEVTEVKAVPYAPLSQPVVKRLIATIRREFLDPRAFLDCSRPGEEAAEF